MCCIISMLGHDAHINAYLTHIEVIFLYLIDELLLSTTTLKREQSSEPMNPGPIFNHKKHLPITFILLFICSTILIRKYINIFIYLICTQNPKTNKPLPLLFSLFQLLTLLYFSYYFIYFYLHETLCLTTTRWSWGHKALIYFAGLLEEERKR